MSDELIKTILSSLEYLSECDDSNLRALCLSALSAANASTSRAQIPNTRVAALAQHSVAASAAAPLRSYLSGNTRSISRDVQMRNGLLAAFKLVQNIKLDPIRCECPSVEMPEGWGATPRGTLTIDTQFGPAELIYKPCMPGGDWTLALNGIPVSFGANPKHAVKILETIIDLIAKPPQTRPNPFRRSRAVNASLPSLTNS